MQVGSLYDLHDASRAAAAMKHHGLRSGCPIHYALEVVGDSWSLLVVRDLLYSGGATYTELLKAREGISTNILANRLGRLTERGVIARGDDGRYELTDKGRDLVPIMREMIVWSAKHDPETSLPRAIVRRLRAGEDETTLLSELRAHSKQRA